LAKRLVLLALVSAHIGFPPVCRLGRRRWPATKTTLPPATFFNCANVLHLIFVRLLLLGLQGWLQLTPLLLLVLVVLLLGHGCLALGKHCTFPTMHPSSDSLTPASVQWLGACCPGHWRGGLQPASHAWRGWHITLFHRAPVMTYSIWIM
jgi:hypothetical protein